MKTKKYDNSAASQRQRILSRLLTGKSLTTIEGRHELDVLHPAQRVLELRRVGYEIETHWVKDLTPEGKEHRVAKYLLAQEKNK